MKVYIYATYHCDTREVVGHGGELESVCIAEVEIGYIRKPVFALRALRQCPQ